MQIVEKLKQLVASERKITAEIIEHIQEVDRKKIYVQMGYPTLFSFLTENIGYSAASAQRRIEAARLLNEVPEVKEDIKSGSLNLSQVALVAQSIRQKQKEMPEVKIKAEDKKVLLLSIKNQNFENSQKIISQTLDLEIKTFDRKVVQKDESVRMEVTFSKEQMQAFNKVKSLISHINPSASVVEVFDYLVKDYLKRKDPMQSGTKNNVKYRNVSEAEMKNELLAKPEFAAMKLDKSVTYKKNLAKPSISDIQSSKNQASLNCRKRVPISIKRAVWTRDQGKCQHFNPTTGKTCGSPYLLEFDHLKRVRHGGDNHPSNLQLLCKAHNLWRG